MPAAGALIKMTAECGDTSALDVLHEVSDSAVASC
jgi:hypothetical protein